MWVETLARWTWPAAPPTMWRPVFAAAWTLVGYGMWLSHGHDPVLGLWHLLAGVVLLWTGWIRVHDDVAPEERLVPLRPWLVPLLAAAVLLLFALGKRDEDWQLPLVAGIACAGLAATLGWRRPRRAG